MPRSNSTRIYLDNAATSWPKLPQAVEQATDFIRDCGATAGRGTYTSASVADRWLQDARTQIASLVSAASNRDVAMCSSGTHALNAGLWGILRPGDHVITTSAEHNSLLRPLEAYRDLLSLQIDIVDVDACGRPIAAQAEQLLTENTRLLAVGHASNVTGATADLAPWRNLADRSSSLLMVDASQTLGYQTIDTRSAGIDILAAAGHKGLRGLPGTGILVVSAEHQPTMRALLPGGTGTASESLSGGLQWPQAVETGNLNLPGIISMAVSAQYLNDTPQRIHDWRPAFERLASELGDIPEITRVGWSESVDLASRIPVLSLQVDGWDPHDLAAVLDEFHSIEARAGLHCAALVHQFLDTQSSGGTLRLSPGHGTTETDIETTIRAFKNILSGV